MFISSIELRFHYTYIYILFKKNTIFHLSWDIEYSSLCFLINTVQTKGEQNQTDCVSLKKKRPSPPGTDLLRALLRAVTSEFVRTLTIPAPGISNELASPYPAPSQGKLESEDKRRDRKKKMTLVDTGEMKETLKPLGALFQISWGGGGSGQEAITSIS